MISFTRAFLCLCIGVMTLAGCENSAPIQEPLTESQPATAASDVEPQLLTEPDSSDSPTAAVTQPDVATVPDPELAPLQVAEAPPLDSVTSGPGAVPVTPPVVKQPEQSKPAGRSQLDEDLANLQIPPPWLESIEPAWDTSKPWKEARLEIRRLLGLNKEDARREGIKLLWEYHNKNDIGDGHEYGFDLFLGGEKAWAVKEFREWLPAQTEYLLMRGWTALASLYVEYGEFERAEQTLKTLITKVPDHAFPLMREAEVHDGFGDLYVAWGMIDKAKHHYAEAVRLYPQGKPKYGRHLLPRRAKKVQAKLDLLSFRALTNASLRDGRYRQKALGYSGDINLTVVIENGRVSDITLTHQEKIDQNACVIIPRRITDGQSLKVDGITGATITKDAIVGGAFQALKQAGLK